MRPEHPQGHQTPRDPSSPDDLRSGALRRRRLGRILTAVGVVMMLLVIPIAIVAVTESEDRYREFTESPLMDADAVVPVTLAAGETRTLWKLSLPDSTVEPPGTCSAATRAGTAAEIDRDGSFTATNEFSDMVLTTHATVTAPEAGTYFFDCETAFALTDEDLAGGTTWQVLLLFLAFGLGLGGAALALVGAILWFTSRRRLRRTAPGPTAGGTPL